MTAVIGAGPSVLQGGHLPCSAGAMPPALQNEFHTPSVSQRPVGRFCSTTSKHNPSVPNLPRAKPGTPSVSQRPVGRFLLALRLAQPTSLELAPALPVGRFLLALRLAKPIRHAFVRGDSPQKIPRFLGT